MGLTPLRIGLTGGIGSGKSTVATMLVAHGATLVDTDAIARDLTAPSGAAIAAIRDAFGAEALAADGSLDRARMRARAFADPDTKRRLEAILHPLIALDAERLAEAGQGSAGIVFDVPLLVESQRWRALVGRVWVVDCSEATQVARVVARSGWADDTVRAVLARQATRAERRAAADAVILNEGLTLTALAAEVDALWRATLPVAVEESSA